MIPLTGAVDTVPSIGVGVAKAVDGLFDTLATIVTAVESTVPLTT